MIVYYIELFDKNDVDLFTVLPKGLLVYRWWGTCLQNSLQDADSSIGVPHGFLYAYEAELEVTQFELVKSGAFGKSPVCFNLPTAARVVKHHIIDCDVVAAKKMEEKIARRHNPHAAERPIGVKLDALTEKYQKQYRDLSGPGVYDEEETPK